MMRYDPYETTGKRFSTDLKICLAMMVFVAIFVGLMCTCTHQKLTPEERLRQDSINHATVCEIILIQSNQP